MERLTLKKTYSRSKYFPRVTAKALVLNPHFHGNLSNKSNVSSILLKSLKMSTTTMHFGPEWMRTKHQPLSRSSLPPPSPPPASTVSGSAVSTYSALVSATPPAPSEASDDVHPFRYSKEELVRIYHEGGKGGLGLEVERWEGVIREAGAEPVALREMSEAEKKVRKL